MGWLPSWNYRIKITVNNEYVDADLTDFPMYVDLADLPAGFHTYVNQTDGRDIRVTEADGFTEVPREVVFYDATTNTGELHFKGDILNSTDVDFYIYYGNSAASDYGVTDTYGRNNVWTNDFGGVWHMGESTLVDSTGQVGNSTTQTGTTLTAGRIGKATTYASASSQRSIIPTATSIDEDCLSSITYTMWARATSAWTRSLEKGDQYFLLNLAGSGSQGSLIKVGGVNKQADIGTLSTSVWYYIGGRYSYSGGSTGVLNAILNGAVVGTTTGIAGAIDGSTKDLYLGSDDGGLYYFNGNIDELRISPVVRATTWISTEYNNQNDPSSFFTIGTVEANTGIMFFSLL